MIVQSEYCHILDNDISIILDIYGKVNNISCPAFDYPTKLCILKYQKVSGGIVTEWSYPESRIGVGDVCCEWSLHTEGKLLSMFIWGKR